MYIFMYILPHIGFEVGVTRQFCKQLRHALNIRAEVIPNCNIMLHATQQCISVCDHPQLL